MSEPPSHPPPLEYEEAPPAPEEPPQSNFERAFEQVIGLEGGYSWDPSDYGGETNWGVSKRSYPEVDIKNLTERGAKSLYLRDFWNRMRLSDVEDAQIAAEIFEQGVNLGTSGAIKNLQKAINLVGNELVSIDGVIGPQTLKAVNKIAKTNRREALLKTLDGFQFEHYLNIVEDDPDQKKFFVGWLRRIA